jgi:hypothetical protein
LPLSERHTGHGTGQRMLRRGRQKIIIDESERGSKQNSKSSDKERQKKERESNENKH